MHIDVCFIVMLSVVTLSAVMQSVVAPNFSHLIISDEALVHSPVLLLDGVDPQDGVAVANVLAVLHPADALHRVALVVALEAGRPAVVHHLLLRFDLD